MHWRTFSIEFKYADSTFLLGSDLDGNSFNKYTSICARATRQALKEEERAAAERRGFMALRYQEWKDGKASENVSSLHTPQQQHLRSSNALQHWAEPIPSRNNRTRALLQIEDH